MANFEAFCWNFSSSTNSEFGRGVGVSNKSGGFLIVLRSVVMKIEVCSKKPNNFMICGAIVVRICVRPYPIK